MNAQSGLFAELLGGISAESYLRQQKGIHNPRGKLLSHHEQIAKNYKIGSVTVSWKLFSCFLRPSMSRVDTSRDGFQTAVSFKGHGINARCTFPNVNLTRTQSSSISPLSGISEISEKRVNELLMKLRVPDSSRDHSSADTIRYRTMG